ncbi:MAG: hypothetical protein KKD07_02390, partial [Candidatus Omnitrophica bacterium]|nr:hypothetical protein [Candidatus Omnitrophota bacterium]
TNQQKRLYGKNKEHILNAVIFFIKSIKILKIQTVRIAGPLVLGRYYGFNAVELINKLWAHIAGVEPQSNDYILGLTPQAIHENMSESGGVLAGGAIRKSKAAVVSMSHIDATSLETFIPVLQRLSLHEVGHLFELSHCPNACVMSKISYMFEYNTFCPTCEALINKRKTLQGLERASMQKATTYGSPFKFIESMSKEVLDVGVNVIKKGKTVVVKFSSELNKSYQDALVALINYSVALSGASKTKYAVRTKNVFLRDDISIRVAEFNDQYCRGYGENSVACVSEDGKVLYINFEVLQVIASLKTVAQREDFMTFIHGQIEGHEVFHIDEIQRTGKTSEENVLKRNILYLENDQVVLKATCNVINDPKVYGIRADFEMSERLNDLEREYYSNQGRSIAARMFSKGILSAEDLSISEKTVNRLIIWKAAAEVIGAAWLLLADMEKVPTALHDEIILKLGERTYEFIERYKELKKIVYSPRIKGGKVVGRKTIENYIKLFVVTAKYYEVIVLRFARMTELLSTLKMDTTDNRQYARYLSLKARHVDSIIAEFLLLRRAASVLKSKSLIVLDPEEYERIDKEIVEEVGFETREEGERYLDRVSDAVKAYLLGNDQIRCNIPEEVINEISLVDIRTRLKSVYSYANKERRIREKAVKSQGSVGTIDDILGLMIVVESEDDVHAAHALLQDIQKELGWLKYNRLSRDLQYKDPKVWGKYAGYHTALKDEDGRNIEVVLFDRENYEKYLLGTSAHWEYAAQKDEKELADQSFKDLMEIEMTGDLKKDFQAALDQFAKEVIVVAVIEIQKDHYVYIPVSLGEGATLFDLAAHPLVDVVNGSQYYGAYYVEVGEERGEVVVDKAGINVARRIKSKDQIQTGTTILFPLKAKDSIKLRIRHTENSITNRARLISSMLPLPEAGKKSLMTSGKEKVWKNKYLLKQKEKNYSEFLMLLVDVNDYKDLEDLYKAYSIGFVTDETIRDFALQLGRVRLEGTLDYERSRHLSEADLFIISQEYILTAYYLPFAYVNDLLNSDDAFLIALGMNQIDINDIGKKLSSSKAGIVSQYDEVLGVADITFIFQSIRPGRLYSVVRLASQYGNIKNVLVKVVRDLKTNKGKYKVDITIEGISKTKNEELLRAANSILDASSKETYVWQDKARKKETKLMNVQLTLRNTEGKLLNILEALWNLDPNIDIVSLQMIASAIGVTKNEVALLLTLELPSWITCAKVTSMLKMTYDGQRKKGKKYFAKVKNVNSSGKGGFVVPELLASMTFLGFTPAFINKESLFGIFATLMVITSFIVLVYLLNKFLKMRVIAFLKQIANWLRLSKIKEDNSIENLKSAQIVDIQKITVDLAEEDKKVQRVLEAIETISLIEVPMNVAFVVGMYNEQRRLLPKTDENPFGEDALRRKVEQLQELHQINQRFNWQLLLVDDGTPSMASAECARRLWEKIQGEYAEIKDILGFSQIQVVADITPDIKKKLGSQKGYAVRYGMQMALDQMSDRYIGYTEADLSTDLRQTGLLVYPFIGRAEIGAAIGSRRAPGAFVENVPLEGQITSILFNLYVRSVLGPIRKVRDTQRGFKLFRPEVLSAILPEAKDGTFSFDTELLLLTRLAGYEIAEVGIHWRDSTEASTFSSVSSNTFKILKNITGQREHIENARQRKRSEQASKVQGQKRV